MSRSTRPRRSYTEEEEGDSDPPEEEPMDEDDEYLPGGEADSGVVPEDEPMGDGDDDHYIADGVQREVDVGYDSDACAIPGCPKAAYAVICDFCNRAWHHDCVYPQPLTMVPEAFWQCPHCVSKCSTCRKPEAEVSCRHCLRIYHATCLSRPPPPPRVNEHGNKIRDPWLCQECESKAVYVGDKLRGCIELVVHKRPYAAMEPAERLRRVNGWRAAVGLPLYESVDVLPPAIDEESEDTEEFLVKWEGRAHWHCSWITNTRGNELAKIKVRNFLKKWPEACAPSDAPTDDLLNVLYPGCTTVHRIIAGRETSLDGITITREYLVKWVGQEYALVTWELDTELMDAGFNGMIVDFIDREIKGTAPQRVGNLCPPDDWDKVKPLKKPQKFKLLEGDTFWALKGGTLHPYQMEGVNWLRERWWTGANVILADEMGLGKTVQTIGFLRAAFIERSEKDLRPHLVVVPLSVVPNWEREFAVWAPDLNVVALAGAEASRKMVIKYEFLKGALTTGVNAAKEKEDPGVTTGPGGRRSGAGKAADNNGAQAQAAKRVHKAAADGKIGYKFHILITSYETACSEANLLRGIDWDIMVFDEGHRLKAGGMSKTYAQLTEFPSRSRLLLTGTPLQNNVEELFNLLSFIEPKKFGSSAQVNEQFSIGSEGQVEKLQGILSPHFLRRVKRDVNLDIPDKHELIVRVELSPAQKETYRNVLSKNYAALEATGGGAAVGLNNIVVQLKKVCQHSYLIHPPPIGESGMPSWGPLEELENQSGKLQLLSMMLPKLKKGGNRVLLFSQFIAVLDIMEDYCLRHNWGVRRIDGGVSTKDRQRMIDDFNNSYSSGNETYFIFLLSTRAGGVGINLATADTVIIHDVDWNPHNDLQALSRAHRIGQKSSVMVYRLVCRATVEERIMTLAKKKMLLEHVVVAKAGRQQSVSQDELNDVIRFGAEALFAETSDNKDSGEGSKGLQGAVVAAQKWGDGNTGSSTHVIVWDDAGVDGLLDRKAFDATPSETTDGLAGGDAKESQMAGLLASFKVASFSMEARAGEGADDETEGSAADPIALEEALSKQAELFPPPPIDTGKTWDQLLAREAAEAHEDDAAARMVAMGKGKRNRKQILNYIPLVQTSKPRPSDDEEFSDDHSDFDASEKPKRRRTSQFLASSTDEPPTHFNDLAPEQKRAIIVLISTYGCPGWDWTELARRVIASKKTKLPAYAGCTDPVAGPLGLVPLLKSIVKDLRNPSSPMVSGKDQMLVRRAIANIGVMNLLYDKEIECRGKPFFVNDRRLMNYDRSRTPQASPHWTTEQDRYLCSALLRHGSATANWRSILLDPEFKLIENIAAVQDSPLVYNDEGQLQLGNREQKTLTKYVHSLQLSLGVEHTLRERSADMERSLACVLEKMLNDIGPQGLGGQLDVLLSECMKNQQEGFVSLKVEGNITEKTRMDLREVVERRNRCLAAREAFSQSYSTLTGRVTSFESQEPLFELGPTVDTALRGHLAIVTGLVTNVEETVTNIANENALFELALDRLLANGTNTAAAQGTNAQGTANGAPQPQQPAAAAIHPLVANLNRAKQEFIEVQPHAQAHAQYFPPAEPMQVEGVVDVQNVT